MDLRERVKELCKKNGTSMNQVEIDLSFGKGYLSKLGESTPNAKKIQKIADYFGVTVDYLLTGNNEPKEKAPELTARDERDIAKDLDRIMGEIQKGDDGPLYYNGVEIDNASLSLLQNAIEYALRETKKENKVKYNPNKNKK